MTVVTSIDQSPTRARGLTQRLVTFNRPSATTAYAAGDVVSDSTSQAAALVFPNVGDAASVVRSRAVYEENNGTPPDFELWLFHEEPTNHLDNAPLALTSVDLASLAAVVEIGSKTVKIANATASPDGAIVYEPGPREPIYVRTTNGKLYGLLVTRGIFTPVTGTKIGVYLDIKLDL